jgi:hypothetical protein
MKKRKRRTYLPTFLRFFAIFRSDFRKYLYGVFGFLMQRNGQKRDKKKSMGKYDRKKVLFSQLFRPKAFDINFPQNVFYGVFELPLSLPVVWLSASSSSWVSPPAYGWQRLLPKRAYFVEDELLRER